VGIVHLGIGAFHRCHMAVYTDDVLSLKAGTRKANNWRILGVSLRNRAIADQLNPQDGLYTVVVKDSAQTTSRVIGSVAGVLFAPDEPALVIAMMAHPDTRIISLTITEKGYCIDPATGQLNLEHPDIVHDLANLYSPRSAVGYLVAALALRQAENAGPVTILTCDNLPANGYVVARIVRGFAELSHPGLTDWISSNVAFPCTMVDRIVPAMEASDVELLATRHGLMDSAALQTEPFTQWVIEDNFAAGRPAWEKAGALLVEDVEFFEVAKLRMLNGSHSALAYLGYLSGYRFVHEAMAVKPLRRFVDRLIGNEAAASLLPPAGVDLDQYRAELLHRYDNSALPHRTYQIAMDGSQKIPQRLLGTLRHHLKNNGPISACSLAVAGWMRYVMAVDESGQPIHVQDPLADKLKALVDNAGPNPATLVAAFLELTEVFGGDLKNEQRLRAELVEWLGRLLEDGALQTVEHFSLTHEFEKVDEQNTR
jgi:fructuronate reductase